MKDCVTCGRPAGGRRRYCDICRAITTRDTKRRHRAKHPRRRVCRMCGGPKLGGRGLRLCKACGGGDRRLPRRRWKARNPDAVRACGRRGKRIRERLARWSVLGPAFCRNCESAFTRSPRGGVLKQFCSDDCKQAWDAVLKRHPAAAHDPTFRKMFTARTILRREIRMVSPDA